MGSYCWNIPHFHKFYYWHLRFTNMWILNGAPRTFTTQQHCNLIKVSRQNHHYWDKIFSSYHLLSFYMSYLLLADSLYSVTFCSYWNSGPIWWYFLLLRLLSCVDQFYATRCHGFLLQWKGRIGLPITDNASVELSIAHIKYLWGSVLQCREWGPDLEIGFQIL